jgi:outer membrane protein TolC
VNLLEKRFKGDIAGANIGYYQLKSNLDNTRALIPQLETSLRQANNQLCVLLGMPVRDLLAELGEAKIPDPDNAKKTRVQIPAPENEAVVVGIEANLLMRRPDVLAAESALKIQSAQIGIAEAEMYPHFGINGTIGLAADSFTEVLSKHSWTGSIGPTMTWNILNYGRLLGNVRLQNYQYQQFVAQYQNTLLTANQDAENAMVAYLQSLDQAKNLRDSAKAAKKVVDIYTAQYDEKFLTKALGDGGALFNQLFTTINFMVAQEDAAAQAEGNVALNLILLYRAMGGGWQNKCPPSVNGRPDDYRLPVTAPLPAVLRPAFGAPVPLDALRANARPSEP